MEGLPLDSGGRLAPALFLDFDGTLVGIARRPDEVRPDPRLPPALRRLHGALDGALAIVSGRPLAEIDALLAPLRLPGAGAHGIERRGPDGQLRVRAGAPPDHVIDVARELQRRHAGLRVEIKPSTLALHFREAPALEALCVDAARAAVAATPGWAVQLGKCVAEIRPHDVTKGRTIEWFMAAPPFAGRLPVFVGDDDADEDGFEVVQAAGGLGVKVGPGPTRARMRLDSHHDVLAWLERLAQSVESRASERHAAGVVR